MNYWQFKFKDELWENFQKLEIGDTFTTTITDKEKNKLNCRVGDIVFWYRTGSKKDIINGIYYVTEFVSNVREDEEYTNDFSVEMRVIASHKDTPFILQNNGFTHIVEQTKKGNFFQFIRYLFHSDDGGVKLYELLKQNNQKLNDLEELCKDDYEIIEKIKEENINSGKMFNPFLDMNLIKLEVKHLSFITNLLDLNGTHFQGTKFLKSFLKSLLEYKNQESNKYLIQMLHSNNQDIKVQSEKSITTKSSNEKGRIDIYIESDEYIIAIEGKIESKDHSNQLIKYDDFLQKQGKAYLLIYLTKEGEKPTQKSPDNLQLMSFSDGIIDFIDYALEEKLPEKIKSTLNEYQKSLVTYLNGLDPTWSYTLDILKEITQTEKTFKQYKNMKDIYYRNPDKYRLTAVEDVAFNFEKAKAYIEMKFLYKLHENIISAFEQNKPKDNTNSCILKIREDDVSKMHDLNKIYKQRKKRLSPIIKTSEEVMLDLGMVCFSLYYKEYDCEKTLSVMNTTLGLLVVEGDLHNEVIPAFKRQQINKYDTKIKADIFFSKNISKLLDKKYMQKQIDIVLENMPIELEVI